MLPYALPLPEVVTNDTDFRDFGVVSNGVRFSAEAASLLSRVNCVKTLRLE
jgi:hypothetical protein